VVLTVLAVLAAVVALGGLLAHASPTPFQWSISVTSFAWYAMWAAPVAVVFAILARRWATVAVAAVLTALLLVVQLPGRIAESAPTHGRPITVMQANLRLGNADPAALVRLVRTHHVELLATEELTFTEEDRLVAAGLAKLMPYRFTRPLPGGGGGLGMWSRYPLSQPVDVPGFWLGVLTARVTLPGGQHLTFVTVHLSPPYPYPAGRWRDELGRLAGVLRRLPDDGPVLAPGDYNATVDHAQFRDLLAHGYADSAAQAGAGYPASYPNDRWFGPVIAIDHLLTRRAVATALDTLGVPGSDHRALLVHLRLEGS
jgi:endonuclease/exonuclease/phosphatase (EEP) superfamily protein YafD